MATINALCPVGSYSSQSRQTAVQKNARGAQTSTCSSTTSLERCESPFFFKCDAHVDLIAFELTFNVNVWSMQRAAPRFDRDGAPMISSGDKIRVGTSGCHGAASKIVDKMHT